MMCARAYVEGTHSPNPNRREDKMETCNSRTIDELGRIVLPKELREAVGWAIGDKIDILLNEDTLTLRLSEKVQN